MTSGKPSLAVITRYGPGEDVWFVSLIGILTTCRESLQLCSGARTAGRLFKGIPASPA